MYYLKYVLVGYKLDEENDTVYEMDILDYSDEAFIIDEELKEIYHHYDVLKVYEDKTSEYSTCNTDKRKIENFYNE